MSEFEDLCLEDEDKEYIINLPYHLSEADMANDLYELLTEFEFLEHKIEITESQKLVEDYDLAKKPEIQLLEKQKLTLYSIQRALQQSANVLQQDKTQLPGQLLSRLFNLKNTDLNPFLEQIKNWKGYPWLRPIKANLLTPRDPLVRTIPTQHPAVANVAISADGKFALSAGYKDGLLKLWDLTTGELEKTLEMKQTWNLTRELLKIFEREEMVAAITDEEMRDKTWATALAISPEANWGLTGSYTETLYSPKSTQWDRSPEPRNCVIELWNLSKGKSVLTFGVGHKDVINSLSLSSNGDYALVGTARGELIVCDLNKRRNEENNIQRFSNWGASIHSDMTDYKDGDWVGVRAVAMSFDGRWALAASDDFLKVWDLVQGCLHQIIPLKPTRKIKALTVNPEGLIILLSKEGNLSSIKSETLARMTPADVPKSIWKLDEDYSRNIKDVIKDSNRSELNLRLTKTWRTIQKSLAEIWEQHQKTRSESIQEIPINLPYGIVPIVISPDAQWAISLTKDGGIQLWDLSIAQETIR